MNYRMTSFLERNYLSELFFFFPSIVDLLLLCFGGRVHSVAQVSLEPTLYPRLTSNSP